MSIRPVFNEIARGKDELKDWAVARKQFFYDVNDVGTIGKLREIADWVKQQNYKERAISEFFDVADYPLVAYAAAYNLVVVTHEQPGAESKKRVKIPDVCTKFNVRYTDTFQMMRDLGVKL